MTARRPDHLKLLAGTARPDRAAPATPALPAIEAVPPPPPWMTNLHAVKEWNRLAPVLVACKLLNAGTVGLFAQMCAVHGRLVQMWAEGSTPTAALLSAYRALCNELGLSSMTLPAAVDKSNRFLNIGKRR